MAKLIAFLALLLPLAAQPALQQINATDNGAVSLAKINGNLLPIAQSCVDASGSASAQSCTTAITFTPSAGYSVIYTASMANAGALTLSVNGQSPAVVTKWLGTALAAGDMPAARPMLLTYDGTRWEMYTIGNVPSGGGGTITAINGTSSQITSSLSGTTVTLAIASPFTFPGAIAGTANFTGTFQAAGVTQTFPTSGAITGNSDVQTLTNKSIAASEINSGTIAVARLPVGTASTLGVLQGDGNTLTISSGVISCTPATTTQVGCVTTPGSSGAQSASQLTDFLATKTSGAVLTIGSLCSSTQPCQARLSGGGATYVQTAPATVTISGTSSSDTVFIYSDGTALYAGYNGAETLTCSGCTAVPGVTTWPINTIPLWEPTITGNAWGVITEAMDFRTVYSAYGSAAGAGIAIVKNPSTGIDTYSVDSTVTPRYFKAAGAPSINCSQGRDFYTNTTTAAEFYCAATNTWQQLGNSNVTSQFVWSASPSGTLTASTPATITIACPAGVYGSATGYRVELATVGTAEPVTVTGGSCAGSGSGTLTFTPANNHGSGYTIGTATAGLAECENYLANIGNGGECDFPAGTNAIHGSTNMPVTNTANLNLPRYSVGCAGPSSCAVVMQSDYSTSDAPMINFAGSASGIIAGCVLNLNFSFPAQPDSTNVSLYTHWPAAIGGGAPGGCIRNTDISGAWTGIDGTFGANTTSLSSWKATDLRIGAFNAGILFGNMGDFLEIENLECAGVWSNGTTNNNTVGLTNAWCLLTTTSGSPTVFVHATNVSVYGQAIYQQAGGYITISNLQCDSYQCWKVAGGNLTINGGYADATTSQIIGSQSGGFLQVNGMSWLDTLGSGKYMVTFAPATMGTADAVFNGLTINTGGADTSIFNINGPNVFLTFNDSHYNGDGTGVGPLINVTSSGGGCMIMSQSNFIYPTSNGSANYDVLGATCTAGKSITGNIGTGWTVN
jgi:hypothetical protein